MELFKAAGLPDGVINMVTVDGKKYLKLFLKTKILLDYILLEAQMFSAHYGKI